jgi:hypothetical protein
MEDNYVEENKCSPDDKPISRKPCFNAPCGSRWEAGKWAEVIYFITNLQIKFM